MMKKIMGSMAVVITGCAFLSGGCSVMQRQLELPEEGFYMESNPWFDYIENEEKEFIRQLILATGSLKELAKVYDVSYPTVRLRLDRVINKVKLYSEQENNPFVSSIMQMVIGDKIS